MGASIWPATLFPVAVLLISLLLCYVSPSCAILPLVRSNGVVFVGLRPTPNLDEFRGIRYGDSPEGALRFARPRPYLRKGLSFARRYSPGCPQPASSVASTAAFREDCLALNIVRPSLRHGPLLPVVVWIHGGANINGQSDLYHGINLVKHSLATDMPIIFVSINYRLNGFGFLVSEQLHRDGDVNLGLHDQELAMQWVKSNVHAFGGDPSRITVAGESAGSTDLWAHIVRQSRSDRWLFQGAMLISGAPGGAYPHVTDATSLTPYFDSLAREARCQSRDKVEELQCLRSLTFESLNELINSGDQTWSTGIGNKFGWVKDGHWFNASIWDELNLGEFTRLPRIVVGLNANEGTRCFNCTSSFIDGSKFTRTITNLFGDSSTAWTSELLSTYRSNTIDGEGNNSMGSKKNQHLPASSVSDIFTDIYWASGVLNTLQTLSKQQKHIWGYVFSQKPPKACLELPYGFPGTTSAEYACMGSYHSSILPYLFGDVFGLVDATFHDILVSKDLMERALRFFHYGDPNFNIYPFEHDAHWHQYSTKSRGVLEFSVGQNPDSANTTETSSRMIDSAFRVRSIVRLGSANSILRSTLIEHSP